MLIFGFILLLLCSSHVSYGAANLADETKRFGLSFLSGIDMRKNQQADLEKIVTDLKRRREESFKGVVSSMTLIGTELAEAQQKIKSASSSEADFLNKKITILHDRRQNLLDYQELWRDTIDNVERHLKLLTDTIDFFQTSRQELKPAYTWKELRDAQLRVTEHSVKSENNKSKRNNLKKQKNAMNERLSSLEKQKDVKNKERQKIVSQIDKSVQKKTFVDSTSVKFDADILSQELIALSEKIQLTKLLSEKMDLESRYWDDVIEFEQYKTDEEKVLLEQIENRLVIDYNDVEIAKVEWKNEIQNALTLKEEINQFKEPKKQAKEKVALDVDVLNKRIGELKAKGAKGQPMTTLLKSQLRKIATYSAALDMELQLLDAKKDLADTLVQEKELQYNMIELRYKLKLEAENVDVLLSTFQNKLDLATSSLKTLKDKRTQAITALIDANRAIDKLKTAEEKLKGKAASIYRGRERMLNTILTNFEDTREQLGWQLEFTQAFLAVNAELISHQEKIINQYELIINDLETKHSTNNIWMRSPLAISLDAFWHSVLEAETFFKKLYWETPAHFKPSAIIKSIKAVSLYDFGMLLLFFLVFAISFALFRVALGAMKKYGSNIIEQYQGRTRYLYFHLLLAFVEFAYEHCGLLFAWFFIFLHIRADFRYIFSTLLPFASRYSITMFYLLSVPILMYLSNCFIDKLKDLNKRLSFLLFAETFQDKFILLVTMFCYATALLLPLRLAVLSYTDMLYSEFAIVILAAYSFVLGTIFLFLFTKEDVLKFVPSHTTFFIWLKRKIDKHYYPVFVFFISLLILANPYIGYSNMAWFLAFAVPCSVLLFYLIFASHFYIRKYAVFIFMKEEDEDIIDKFEHAKAYYGFFVIFSFVVLLFLSFAALARIWGFNYTPADIWKALSEQWVIRIGVDNKLGFVEFMLLGLFIAVGFLASSLVHRFILNKLFDILRSEPGTQNTISRISHYLTIFFALLLGLNAIHLQQFMFWVAAPLSIGLGLALKDIASDVVSGFFILIERPIEIGNYVQIDNTQGTVHKIAARATTLITSRNHSIIIPNRDLTTKWIINWGHGRFAVGFEIDIRVAHSSDPDKVKKVLSAVLQANPLILKVPSIVVRLENIEDNGLYFLTRAFISARRVKEQWEISASLRNDILKAFKDNNILLAKPARVIQVTGANDVPMSGGIDIKFDKQ